MSYIETRNFAGAFCRTGETRIGRVFCKISFCLALNYRGKGIGTAIYELEDKLCEKWEADEIQLYAAQDGRFKWREKGYEIDCIDAGHIETQYEIWCKEQKKNYEPLNDIRRYPKDFLKSDLVHGFKMYKEL